MAYPKIWQSKKQVSVAGIRMQGINYVNSVQVVSEVSSFVGKPLYEFWFEFYVLLLLGQSTLFNEDIFSFIW